jgi:hypothetical protein
MGGVRSMAACLKAAERDNAPRVVPFPSPAARGPVYGSAHKLKPVFTDDHANACPCCNSRAWHVGRITAECAACETVLPIVRAATFWGSVQ